MVCSKHDEPISSICISENCNPEEQFDLLCVECIEE